MIDRHQWNEVSIHWPNALVAQYEYCTRTSDNPSLSWFDDILILALLFGLARTDLLFSFLFSSPLLSVFRPLFWIPGVSWPSLHSRRQTLPLARAIDQPCPSGDWCCLRTTSKKCIHSYWYSLPLTSLILLTLLTRCCSNAQHPSQKEISMIIAEKAWMHCRIDQAMDKCNQTWMHASNGWRMKRQ